MIAQNLLPSSRFRACAAGDLRRQPGGLPGGRRRGGRPHPRPAAGGKRAVFGTATGSTPGQKLLCGARPPAPRGGPELRERGHVQPRRILPPFAGPSAKLPPVHGGAPVRPDRPPEGPDQPAGRNGAQGGRRRPLRGLRGTDPGGRRHRLPDPRHRPHRAHRLQRAGQPAPLAHAPGDARSPHPPRRRRGFPGATTIPRASP